MAKCALLQLLNLACRNSPTGQRHCWGWEGKASEQGPRKHWEGAASRRKAQEHMCPCQALLCVYHCCWLRDPRLHGKQGMLHNSCSIGSSRENRLDQKLTQSLMGCSKAGALGWKPGPRWPSPLTIMKAEQKSWKAGFSLGPAQAQSPSSLWSTAPEAVAQREVLVSPGHKGIPGQHRTSHVPATPGALAHHTHGL